MGTFIHFLPGKLLSCCTKNLTRKSYDRTGSPKVLMSENLIILVHRKIVGRKILIAANNICKLLKIGTFPCQNFTLSGIVKL